MIFMEDAFVRELRFNTIYAKKKLTQGQKKELKSFNVLNKIYFFSGKIHKHKVLNISFYI